MLQMSLNLVIICVERFCTAKVLLIVNIGVSKNSNLVEKCASHGLIYSLPYHCDSFLHQIDDAMSNFITNFVVRFPGVSLRSTLGYSDGPLRRLFIIHYSLLIKHYEL
jgi:hypothetical protein